MKPEVGSLNWWLGIAEVAYILTFRSENLINGVDADWARNVIAVRTRLALHDPNESIMQSLMTFKIRLLITTKGQIDAELANPSEIISWFYQDLPFSLNEVKSIVSEKPLVLDHDFETLRKLRHIKNRLSRLRTLQEHDLLPPPTSDLAEWLTLHANLP